MPLNGGLQLFPFLLARRMTCSGVDQSLCRRIQGEAGGAAQAQTLQNIELPRISKLSIPLRKAGSIPASLICRVASDSFPVR